MSVRLDIEMTRRGLAPSREQAQRLIKMGQVTVDGSPAAKPSTPVTPESAITLLGEGLPFVSRGGLKLQRALEIFPITLTGLICADIGASTGGFTDCMLQNGAKKVYAIDVGTGQLPTPPSWATLGLSALRTPTSVRREQPAGTAPVYLGRRRFISLRLVLPVIARLLPAGGEAVVLVKPQFEAGKGAVGKNGVVKDMKTHLQVLRVVKRLLPSKPGFALRGAGFSPIRGPEGATYSNPLIGSGKGKTAGKCRTPPFRHWPKLPTRPSHPDRKGDNLHATAPDAQPR